MAYKYVKISRNGHRLWVKVEKSQYLSKKDSLSGIVDNDGVPYYPAGKVVKFKRSEISG